MIAHLFSRRQQDALKPALSRAGLVLALLLACGPSLAEEAPPAPPAPTGIPVAASQEPSRSDFLRRLARMHMGGSLSLNWRNVGPRTPGFETQIQNEVYLADIYFGVDGPFVDGIPLRLEWNMPTGSQGQIQLSQLNFEYDRFDGFVFQFGKFLVPFGRYNELYRPDQFLTVTRPLLYASPDSLDLVVRSNSPRPPFSTGYTDIGARASYYPKFKHSYSFAPAEVTLFVVNGLGENGNRQRTFPDPDNLGIANPPTSGVNIDFGHRNNNLADNNNAKDIGGRLVFALSDVPYAWPVPEGSTDRKVVMLGLSGMGGQYDLEANLNHQKYGLDLAFEYFGFSFAGEYLYSFNQFLSPIAVSSAAATLLTPVQQTRQREIIHGYFIQASFPIMKKPPKGKRVTGILVFNQLYRHGPQLDLFLNYNDAGRVIPSLLAYKANTPYIDRRIDKYTAAINWQLAEHFFFKFDYSYWVMGQSTARSANSIGLVDIYQSVVSLVMPLMPWIGAVLAAVWPSMPAHRPF